MVQTILPSNEQNHIAAFLHFGETNGFKSPLTAFTFAHNFAVASLLHFSERKKTLWDKNVGDACQSILFD
jgi:hypothetical protein